jgi:hypothetical protein
MAEHLALSITGRVAITTGGRRSEPPVLSQRVSFVLNPSVRTR